MAFYDEHIIALRHQCRSYGHCRKNSGETVSYYLAKDSTQSEPWWNPNKTPNLGFIR
jgi:hypothetical protein